MRIYRNDYIPTFVLQECRIYSVHAHVLDYTYYSMNTYHKQLCLSDSSLLTANH